MRIVLGDGAAMPLTVVPGTSSPPSVELALLHVQTIAPALRRFAPYYVTVHVRSWAHSAAHGRPYA